MCPAHRVTPTNARRARRRSILLSGLIAAFLATTTDAPALVVYWNPPSATIDAAGIESADGRVDEITIVYCGGSTFTDTTSFDGDFVAGVTLPTDDDDDICRIEIALEDTMSVTGTHQGQAYSASIDVLVLETSHAEPIVALPRTVTAGVLHGPVELAMVDD